ncbi:MAG: PAS domain S-box protein [Candidatus Aminicenantales bacterium]
MVRRVVGDISPNQRAEAANKNSEAFFRLIFENSADGILLTHPDGDIYSANPEACRMFGRTEEEIKKLGRAGIVDTRDPRFPAALEERPRTGKFKGELTLVKKDGVTFPADISTKIFKDSSGNDRTIMIIRDLTERKRAEEGLRESEQKLKEAQRLGRIGHWEFDPRTQQVHWSDMVFALYKRDPKLGPPSAEEEAAYYSPEDAERLRNISRRTIETGEPYEVDVRIRLPGGRYADVVAIGTPVKDAHGRVVKLLGTVQDITERRRAEEALRISEEKYRLLVENATEVILVAQDGMVKFVNHMERNPFSVMTGYSKQELFSSPFLEFIHPDDRNMVGERYLRRLTGDAAQPRYAFRLVARDGSTKWVEVDAIRIDWEGRPATLNFLSDITERKRAEESLRQTEENFRRSLDESPLGIRIVSVEGETLYANRVTLDIYGYDDIEELRSTPLQKRYTPASYAEYQIRKEMRMNGEDCPSEYEINIIRKTGERRRLQVFRKEVLWNGQKQFQSIYRDITETKKMEEKIRESLSGLQKAFSGIIQVLSTVSEKRDPYTAGHQTRVADLTRAIAQEMGLPPERVEGLRLAGTIHDIGKVSTPAEILSKPSRLTNIEFDMVKSHSQVGYDILRDVDFAWPLAEIVLQHHERMDGSGYPRGLKDENILLEARILAVGDVVEAMASHRPYRPALGIEAALEEIEKNSGILYDSDVVSACLGLFREKGFNLK